MAQAQWRRGLTRGVGLSRGGGSCSAPDPAGSQYPLCHSGVTWGSGPAGSQWQDTEAVYFTLMLCSTERSCHQCCPVKVCLSWAVLGWADTVHLNVRDVMYKENPWWLQKANIGLQSWDRFASEVAVVEVAQPPPWGWWRILDCLWNSPAVWWSAVHTQNVERDTVDPL